MKSIGQVDKVSFKNPEDIHNQKGSSKKDAHKLVVVGRFVIKNQYIVYRSLRHLNVADGRKNLVISRNFWHSVILGNSDSNSLQFDLSTSASVRILGNHISHKQLGICHKSMLRVTST